MNGLTRLKSPRTVNWGVALLIATGVFGIVASQLFPAKLVIQGHLSSKPGPILLLVPLIIYIFFSYGIMKARKWVLNLYFVNLLLSSLLFPFIIYQAMQHLGLEIAPIARFSVETIFQITAILLFYSESSIEWFNACKMNRSRS